MEAEQSEEILLRSVALQNAKSILLAREQVERTLIQTKEALEEKTKELSRSLTSIRILHGELETRVRERTAELVKANQALNEEIAERKRVEVEMQTAILAAETANRTKSEFLANMSHEIRTPLNGIIGLTDLMLGNPLDAEQKAFLETVHGSAENLLTIVSDVLDFSKIEYGKLELDHHTFTLHGLIDGVVALLDFQATKKSLKLASNIDQRLPGDYLGDATRISQVLINLVGNAIKFTERGKVRLEICAANSKPGDDPTILRLLFSVHDSGIGIPADRLDRLFKVFSQVDASTTRRYGGSGLGLAISRKLTELMGGTIAVRSTPDQGSTFSFELPLQLAPPNGSPASKVSMRRLSTSTGEPGSRPLFNILVVEDIPTNQMVARAILKRLGYEADISNNGLEAIRAVKNKEYDLIFMDVHMPEMDGLEATRWIRQMESGGRHKRIVALTADVLREELDRCLEVGMDEYATKPIKLETLKVIIDSLHTRRHKEP
jgi:signal transduction histidine kinase/CheY-like chemotaxis protein